MNAERTEIGIVCGQCDQWSPMGSASCVACDNDLSLVPRRSLAPKASPIAPAPEVETRPALDAERLGPSSSGQDRLTGTSPGRERLGGSTPGGSVRSSTTTPQGSGAPAPLRKPSALAMMAMRKSNHPPPPKNPTGAQAPSAKSLDARSSQATPQRSRATPVSVPGATPGTKSAPIDFSKLSQEELMEQARHYVCRSCSSGVPMGHKFCGRCGEAVPPEILSAQTLFFGDMQNPAKAKLILIRGEGMDGLSFHLKAEQHVVGRDGQLPFPDDPFVSRRHANFFYRNGKLVVRDEGSLNGVYMRVRGTVELNPGDSFLAGEQLFRLDLNPKAADGQAPDGTYFYSSPKHPSSFRLVQILQGGAMGMAVCARGNTILIGREGGDLNFPGDLYMSGSHCRIEEAEGRFTLTDLNSRNGTYLRLKSERELGHGDYLFIGRKLLRVELNTN